MMMELNLDELKSIRSRVALHPRPKASADCALRLERLLLDEFPDRTVYPITFVGTGGAPSLQGCYFTRQYADAMIAALKDNSDFGSLLGKTCSVISTTPRTFSGGQLVHPPTGKRLDPEKEKSTFYATLHQQLDTELKYAAQHPSR